MIELTLASLILAVFVVFAAWSVTKNPLCIKNTFLAVLVFVCNICTAVIVIFGLALAVSWAFSVAAA